VSVPRHYVVDVRFNDPNGYRSRERVVVAYSAEDAITQVNADAYDVTRFEPGGKPYTHRSSEATGVCPFLLGDMRIGGGW